MTPISRATGPAAWVRPLLALLLPPLAWFAYEVGLAAALRISCVAVGAGLGAGWGAISLILCGVSAWLAWATARRGDVGSSSSVSWLSRVALLAAGIYALAIAFQTIATLVLPPCAR